MAKTGEEQEFDYGIVNNAAQEIETPILLVTHEADGNYGKTLVSTLPISIPNLQEVLDSGNLTTTGIIIEPTDSGITPLTITVPAGSYANGVSLFYYGVGTAVRATCFESATVAGEFKALGGGKGLEVESTFDHGINVFAQASGKSAIVAVGHTGITVNGDTSINATGKIIVTEVDEDAIQVTTNSGNGIVLNSNTGTAVIANSSSGVPFISNLVGGTSDLAQFNLSDITQASISYDGKFTGNAFIKDGGDGTNLLADDGTTVPISSFSVGAELLVNKQNSLAPDGTNTKYPTVTAVNAGLETKQNTLTIPTTGVGSNLNTLTYANQDGTILYHNRVWFTTSGTISTSGTTVTISSAQFTSSMVEAKLIINGEWRIIKVFTSSTVVTVDSSYSTNYSGVASGNWSVFGRFLRVDPTTGDVLFSSFNSNSSTLVVNSSGISSIALLSANYGISNANGVIISSALSYKFSSTTSATSTSDLAIRRASAGVIEIYDGVTNGNLRDLQLRKIMVNTTTNNGVDAVQVVGSMSATVGATTANQVVILSQLPFKGTYSTTGTATTTFTVSIGQTMANTNYVAAPIARNTLSTVNFSVQNKTTTTFDIVVLTGLTGAVEFDFTITP